MSKELAGIHIASAELEIGRKATAEGAKTLQQLATPGLPRNTELPGASDMYFNLIAILDLECFDHSGRKTDSEAVSLFCDPHANLSVDKLWNI